jgi:diguanylate cyclase (GGDEF)-like protein
MQQFGWVRWIDRVFLDAQTPRDVADALVNFLGLDQATDSKNQIIHLCDALFLTNEADCEAIVIKLSEARKIALVPKNASSLGEIQLFVHLVGLGIQLTQRRQELIAESLLDPLTGLLNRRGWDAYFESQQAVSGVIAFLDIDDFKGLNLEIGYHSADDRLAHFGQILRDSVRATDCVCRWGGDEFIIFFSDASEDGARSRVRDVSRQSEAVIGRSVSFGLVDVLPDRFERGELSQAISRAQQLMEKGNR